MSRMLVISSFLANEYAVPQEYVSLGEWELEGSADNWLLEEGTFQYLLEEDVPA